jgi:general transcription factor 3C polypeptide 5 (transcription factor C subunit 1)
MYKFRADKLPASRNVFYQICDIEDEDVQALIKSDESKPTVCGDKDGWWTSNIQNKCRDLMSQKHEKLSKALANEQKESKKAKK